MQSNLYFWGHNCFHIDHASTFLVTDPWLTPKGAFCGSWFQYPKNHQQQSELIKLSQDKQGWIFVTHEHQDHFDLDTLSKLDKKTKVIIPCFQDKFLFSQIQKLGLECVEVEDGKKFKLANDLFIKLLISDIGVDHDSAILIYTKSFTFFNQNDCRVFDRLDEIIEEVDFYSVQFSGANHHPYCYKNLTADTKKSISKEKVQSKLNSVLTAIKKLKPKLFIPAAGPAIFPFLSSDLSLGKENIFIHQDHLKKFLDDSSYKDYVFPRIGELINKHSSREPILAPNTKELEEYRSGISCEWDSIEDDFDLGKLKRVIMQRLQAIKDIDFDCDYSIEFRWGEDNCSLFIDLENKIVSQKKINKQFEYIIEGEKKYFNLLCHSRWQDVSLTLRGTAFRSPDQFNNIVNIFLFSEPENIRDSLLGSLDIPNERIVVTDINGNDYEINRFCPHQGADLCNAEINDNNELICPRHGWRFDLTRFGRDHAGRTSISAKLLEKKLQN